MCLGSFGSLDPPESILSKESGIPLLTAISSASVELLTTNFCLVDAA